MTGDRLKLLRKTIGLTQEQLAQRLGIGKAALSMIETGKAALSSRNKNILVQELNVNPDWLDSGEGEMFNAEPDLTAYMHRTDNTLPLQSPLLKSGDIVLYKQLKDIGDIFWGDMYLLSIDIDGEEYITVKYIQKSEREGYVKLVSQNPHHADKEVAVDRIRALALVKASIRMNSIR